MIRKAANRTQGEIAELLSRIEDPKLRAETEAKLSQLNKDLDDTTASQFAAKVGRLADRIDATRLLTQGGTAAVAGAAGVAFIAPIHLFGISTPNAYDQLFHNLPSDMKALHNAGVSGVGSAATAAGHVVAAGVEVAVAVWLLSEAYGMGKDYVDSIMSKADKAA